MSGTYLSKDPATIAGPKLSHHGELFNFKEYGLASGIRPHHLQETASNPDMSFGDMDGLPGSYEGPDYALVEVGADGIVIHQRPFLFEGPQFSLRDKVAQRAARLV